MTARELIEQLERIGADVEVRVAYQESWPLAGRVVGVVTPMMLVEAALDGDPSADEDEVHDRIDPEVAWLVVNPPEYGEHPYAPGEAWRAVEAS